MCVWTIVAVPPAYETAQWKSHAPQQQQHRHQQQQQHPHTCALVYEHNCSGRWCAYLECFNRLSAHLSGDVYDHRRPDSRIVAAQHRLIESPRQHTCQHTRQHGSTRHNMHRAHHKTCPMRRLPLLLPTQYLAQSAVPSRCHHHRVSSCFTQLMSTTHVCAWQCLSGSRLVPMPRIGAHCGWVFQVCASARSKKRILFFAVKCRCTRVEVLSPFRHSPKHALARSFPDRLE